ncbi:MAG: NAD(P)-dependent oxidoreductase [Treponema sp.]|nr:NAD(P)-dependent oxidoreductase [Treponema sp.]
MERKPETVIWVIGYKSMLGAELSALFLKLRMPHIISDANTDVTDIESLWAFVKTQEKQEKKIDWIINCTGYPADKAENNSDSCRAVNSAGPANIAKIAKRLRAKFIHISTDSVFDGEGIYSEELCGPRPYRESDETSPTGVIGAAKRDGERGARKNSSHLTYIIRTSWLYGSCGGNFVSNMLQLMKEQDAVFVDDRRRASPTWTYDLALAIAVLIRASNDGENIPSGIYHYTNDGDATQLEFARKIYALGRKFGLLTRDCAINPGDGAELSVRTAEPGYFVLDKRKIRSALHIKLRMWDSSLASYMKYLLPKEKDPEDAEEDKLLAISEKYPDSDLARLEERLEKIHSPTPGTARE